MASRDVIGGYADGTFKPNNDATRGQVAKIIDLATHPEGTRQARVSIEQIWQQGRVRAAERWAAGLPFLASYYSYQ